MVPFLQMHIYLTPKLEEQISLILILDSQSFIGQILQVRLTNSDLSNSTLTRAILAFTNLQGANLEGAGTRTTNLNHCYNHPICD